MAVKIGSARIDERGKISGGKAGDQTKNEVGTQNYYVHSKGWRVLRPNNPEQAAMIAKCMQMACDNNNIGYDQVQRNTLYNVSKPYDFNVSKVIVKTETDCSALVRVCCAYAGITVKDFNTSSQASALLATGAFTELKESKYTSGSSYLRVGDVLVTKTKGHTVVVLTNGSKAGEAVVIAPTKYNLGDRILRNGMEGDDVKELQTMLIQAGYNLGDWGADGDFGDATEIGVRNFQKKMQLEVDGQVGPKTLAALEEVLADKPVINPQQVKIINGNCYIRSEPNTSGNPLGTAKKNQVFNYGRDTSENGWNRIEYETNQFGWVSGKYSKKL